ncbi:late embryogenis abundant protein 41 [Capsicum galapagoense]
MLVLRKGYAVATKGGGRGRGGLNNMMMNKKLIKGGDDVVVQLAPNSAWVPDPVTDYYRPENQADQIDAVELRQMLLKTKFTGH